MEKISKNLYKGEMITNPMDIMRVLKEKKSVFCANSWGLIPAAVLIHFPLIQIIKAIENKTLFFVHK